MPNIRKYLTLNNILISLVVILVFLNWYDDVANFFFRDNPDSNGEFFKVILTGVGGVGIFLTFKATWKRAKDAEDSATAQLESSDAQMSIAKGNWTKLVFPDFQRQ